MKRLVIILSALLCIIMLFACKKSTSPTGNYTLLGRWDLVSDSLTRTFVNTNQQIFITGTPGDYFDFRTDNKLYLKEGTKLDTLAYTLLSDSTVVISSFGITLNGVPEINQVKFSANASTITTPFLINPGTYYRHVVHLSR